MKVAEVEVIYHAGGFKMIGAVYTRVGYSSLEQAKADYTRVANLIQRREDSKNDLPKTLELVGINKLTVPVDSIVAVSLIDFEFANENEKGIKDAFPHLSWKPG